MGSTGTLKKFLFSLAITSLLFFSQLKAQEARGLSTVVNFSFKEKKLSEIMQVFSETSSINILPDEAVKDTKVTLRLENVTLDKALKELGVKYDLLISDRIDNVIHVTKLIKININIKEPVTLNNILKLFETASDKDIIPSLTVLNDKRKLRLSIRNAPFEDALSTIVKSFDYVWFKDKNGFIIVGEAKRLEDEMITRVLPLHFRGVANISASEDGEEEVESTSDDLTESGAEEGSSQNAIIQILTDTIKSEAGKIVYDADTNSIIITDLPEKIREMEKLLEQLDVRPTQLLISAKFMSIDTDNATQFGLDWINGLAVGAKFADLDDGIVFPFTTGSGGFEEDIASVTGPNSPQGTFTLGNLSFSQTQLSLKLLKEYANGEVLQEPSITTLDNRQASIGITKDILYVETSTVISDAATNIENEVQRETSGITLTIVAHYTGKNGDIVINAKPKAETFLKFNDLNGAIVPEIESRNINTTMLIKDGMTGVLGGLKFRSTNDTRRELPILGRVPGLGWLFKKKAKATSDKELIIYISPRIIQDSRQDQLITEIESLSSDIGQTGLFPNKFQNDFEEIPKSKYKSKAAKPSEDKK